MEIARKKAKYKLRILLSVIFLGSYMLFNAVYSTASGPIESEIAVNQINDDSMDYTIAKGVSKGAIPTSVSLLFYGLMLGIWTPFVVNRIQIALKK